MISMIYNQLRNQFLDLNHYYKKKGSKKIKNVRLKILEKPAESPEDFMDPVVKVSDDKFNEKMRDQNF